MSRGHLGRALTPLPTQGLRHPVTFHLVTADLFFSIIIIHIPLQEAEQRIMAPSRRIPAAVELDRALVESKAPLMSRERDWLDDEVPPIKKDEVYDIFGYNKPKFTRKWTSEKEAALRRMPDVKTAVAEINERDDKRAERVTLWKICGRLWRCSPLRLISPRTCSLIYQSEDTDRTKTKGNSVVWSAGFCKLLGRLLVQPLFEEDPRVLYTVLQFAVICRTDNRSRWYLPEGGEFCTTLAQLHESDVRGPTNLNALHEKLRKDAKIKPSRASDLMSILGTAVKRASDETNHPFPLRYPCTVYPVTYYDLKNVLSAMGMSRKDPPTEIVYQTYIASRSRKAEAPSTDQFNDLFVRSWFHGRRRIQHWLDTSGTAGETDGAKPRGDESETPPDDSSFREEASPEGSVSSFEDVPPEEYDFFSEDVPPEEYDFSSEDGLSNEDGDSSRGAVGPPALSAVDRLFYAAATADLHPNRPEGRFDSWYLRSGTGGRTKVERQDRQ